MRNAIAVFIISFAVLITSGNAQAEPDPTAKNLVFSRLQCPIERIDLSNSTLLVCEKTIHLVDVKENGKRLRTILANSQGNHIPLNAFHEGQRIFVRGFRQTDGSIVAREIYRLPQGKASGKKDFPFFRTIPDWNWESIE